MYHAKIIRAKDNSLTAITGNFSFGFQWLVKQYQRQTDPHVNTFRKYLIEKGYKCFDQVETLMLDTPIHKRVFYVLRLPTAGQGSLIKAYGLVRYHGEDNIAPTLRDHRDKSNLMNKSWDSLLLNMTLSRIKLYMPIEVIVNVPTELMLPGRVMA